MSKSAAAVKIGPAHLYVAAVGATYPDQTTAPSSSDWEDLGYSEDGFIFDAYKTYKLFTFYTMHILLYYLWFIIFKHSKKR